jgi:hypothetical protein
MPGTFAHMMLVDALCAESLNEIPGLREETKATLGLYLNYCELGSVSPDYPSLAVLDHGSAAWANVMHYYQTAEHIRAGIRSLLEHPPAGPENERRCIAWLFGYAAHVVTDLTVHPIVAMKVGCYEGHETEHRRCELHQDVYIFNCILHEEICSAEYLRRGGIMTCATRGVLNEAITTLWFGILNAIPRKDLDRALGPKCPSEDPDPEQWHKWFTGLIDKVAEEGGRLPALVRRLGDAELYPEGAELNRTYIDELHTPARQAITYDEVFDRARHNVMLYWGELDAALQERRAGRFTLPNADLDTGVPDGDPLFWKAT